MTKLDYVDEKFGLCTVRYRVLVDLEHAFVFPGEVYVTAVVVLRLFVQNHADVLVSVSEAFLQENWKYLNGMQG